MQPPKCMAWWLWVGGCGLIGGLSEACAPETGSSHKMFQEQGEALVPSPPRNVCTKVDLETALHSADALPAPPDPSPRSAPCAARQLLLCWTSSWPNQSMQVRVMRAGTRPDQGMGASPPLPVALTPHLRVSAAHFSRLCRRAWDE